MSWFSPEYLQHLISTHGYWAVTMTCDLATKEQIIALHTQVNSIEVELRGMKHVKLQSRVADLEEEVFGETRA